MDPCRHACMHACLGSAIAPRIKGMENVVDKDLKNRTSQTILGEFRFPWQKVFFITLNNVFLLLILLAIAQIHLFSMLFVSVF